ncbi:MAG: acetylxylan esterase [Verrucomicrobiales bacterium]|nr:acetylxylan esterase [Verrucomicrobiales bacterium]
MERQDSKSMNPTAPIVPELAVPSDMTAWQQQREVLRATLWKLMGDLPARPSKPEVRIRERRETEDASIETFEFDNGAGALVPGVLILPKRRTGKVPGILYCHWHGGEYDGGKKEVFEKAHTPGVPAIELAKRGYAVIAIDAYCFGERNGQGPGSGEKGGAGEMTASKWNLWFGQSLWGMIVRDDLIALDCLASRPEVDATRLGATGISMGATRTWWAMALDDRLKAGVAVACLTRYQDLIEAGMLKAHGIYYFVPGMLQHFDTEAVISLIAPRAALFLTGDQDGGSPVAGIRKIEAVAREVWRLCGKPDAFESRVYRGLGHVYTPDMWERMLKWMERYL